MDSRVLALLTTWDWRPEVILILGLNSLFFVSGWLRLRRRGRARLASGWRLTSYLAGMIVLGLSLMSAVDVFGQWLFFMHMIQHALMLMIAPPLLLLANPFPFMVWGLPGARRISAWLLGGEAPFRNGLRWLTRPPIVWLAFVTVLWGWHDPNAYNAALRSRWVHDLEHITFFGTALLLWWHAIGAGPRLHARLPTILRIVGLLATASANMIPGVVIALVPTPLYTYYVEVPRTWGLTVMQDQVLSGLIMWIPGTMMYLSAAVILILREIQRSEDSLKQRLPRTAPVHSL
jgi:putative membrane protein